MPNLLNTTKTVSLCILAVAFSSLRLTSWPEQPDLAEGEKSMALVVAFSRLTSCPEQPDGDVGKGRLASRVASLGGPRRWTWLGEPPIAGLWGGRIRRDLGRAGHLEKERDERGQDAGGDRLRAINLVDGATAARCRAVCGRRVVGDEAVIRRVRATHGREAILNGPGG